MIGNTALIIDDKESDGMAITKTLWRKGHPCLFFQYSEEKLSEQHQKLSGIRIIFQDINLLNLSSPSTSDYDQAVMVIDQLLEDDNGPWLLATWSTWENEHGLKLFEHLREELKVSKRPFDFVMLEKGELSEGGVGTHGTVKDLNVSDIENLYSKCLEKIAAFPSFKGLTAWEKSIEKTAHKTVHDISIIPMNLSPENFDLSLGDMLHKISIAELGRKFPVEQKAKSVSRVLNGLASNNSFYLATLDQNAIQIMAPANDVDSESKRIWARKTNFLLHFESMHGEISPGSVYLFKKPKHYYTEAKLIAELEPFYSDETLKVELLGEFKDQTIFNQIKDISLPLLIDITPPCDHAQRKAQWRKFLVGIEVSIPKAELSSKTKEKKWLDLLVSGSKWRGPCFMDDDNAHVKFIYADLRLVMSVPDDNHFLEHLSYKYTIKEQLLRDLIGSVSSHMSRPGIVDLSRS